MRGRQAIGQGGINQVRKAMIKYVLNSDQLKTLIERAIDLFMDYQYRHGYDEPRARSETVMKIMETLRTIKNKDE